MVEVNEALTRKVAELARLELSDHEVKTFTGQLSDILKYMDQLTEVDVQGVEPLMNPLAQKTELQNVLREDIARPSPVDAQGIPKSLSAAPDVIDDGFKVPSIL